MKIVRVVGLATLVWLLTAASMQSAAHAQACDPGCGLRSKACGQAAHSEALACKADCRASSPAAGVGACMTGCASTLRSNKESCRANVPDCLSTCSAFTPDDPDYGCAIDCGGALYTCARDVITTARSNIMDCRYADDRVGCLTACRDTAHADLDTCWSNFQSCLAACGTPPSPTSSLP